AHLQAVRERILWLDRVVDVAVAGDDAIERPPVAERPPGVPADLDARVLCLGRRRRQKPHAGTHTRDLANHCSSHSFPLFGSPINDNTASLAGFPETAPPSYAGAG